ncbi:MAG: FAD-dependent oxidoreductase, partial [Chitinophagaceae bacterium]|nr:FAD-dependent oxidoreductase [Chitinophagaceae bacterium]
MSTRRTFLKQAGLAGAAVFLASDSKAVFSLTREKRVIIIGAGLAGMAAAKKLKEKNIDYVILEARKRVGGRVFSYQIDAMDDLNIELGAEWIGASHQRLLALCDEYKLELINNQFDTHLIYRGRYYKNNEWEYSGEWKKQFDLMLKNY